MTTDDMAPPSVARILNRFAFAGVIALLAFAALLAWGQHRQDSLFQYPTDRPYADLAIARAWAEMGTPTVGTDRVPLQENGVWCTLLRVWDQANLIPAIGPVVLSLAFALFSIPALLSLVGSTSPRPALFWWAIVAWVLIGPVVPDAFSGQPLVLGTVFVSLALSAHMDGLSAERMPLPFSSALWLGLATLVRAEFSALWVAFAFHVLLLRLTRRIDTDALALLVRWLSGVLTLAIALAPILWWNTRALQVPWPPAPDAMLTLNAVDAVGTINAFAVVGFRAMTDAIWNGPLLANFIFRLFVIAGAITLLLDLVRKRLDTPATTLLLGLLVPFAFAPFYPFMGSAGLPFLSHALTPLWILLSGYAVVAALRGVDWLLNKAALPLPRSLLIAVAAALIGSMPLLAGLGEQARAWRAQRAAMLHASAAREKLNEELKSTAITPATPLASDAAGWLLFQGYESVLDLSGRLQPVILGWVDQLEMRDEEGFRAYLAGRGISQAVFWTPPSHVFAGLIDCSPDDAPIICDIK